MPVLIVIHGSDEGKRFEVAGAVISIGRDARSAVRLHDTEVSRRHAEFRACNGEYRLVDLGSSNGTFVNDRRISDVALRTGDQIHVGQTVLLYTAGSALASTEPATNLAEHIRLLSQQEPTPPAIVRAIREEEGGRILAGPAQAAGPWLHAAIANLKTLYQAAQAISHILDTDELLERIMDLVFQSIPAERGCIMLRPLGGESYEPKTLRYRPGVDRQERIQISRTIMDYVLREGEGVLVTDAAHDRRFDPGPSIVSHGIREAVCVPMKGRHETVGVIYFDSRATTHELLETASATARLSEDHLLLAIAIAHQAALALEETRYYQAMVQAERLAAVGQTIAAISHHVKNILQGLKSGSDLLKMGIEDRQEVLLHQGWRIVAKNQQRIYDLVMDMLSYSKDREPALEPTSVGDVIREVVELVQGRINEQNGRLVVNVPAGLQPVPADPEGIHRALLNIVSNALDAMEETGDPVLTIQVRLSDDGQWLETAVSDNGCGIPAERLPALFKPFSSTKGSKGTGLGLAVSRKILREHGGDILVQSQPAVGSTFTLRLPVHSTGSEWATEALPTQQ